MKRVLAGRWACLCAAVMCLAVYTACGKTTGTSESGTTTDTKSLAAIPQIDLSSASSSEGSTSNLAVAKGLLGDKLAETDFKRIFSRLGCETNQRIEEIQRHSDQANSIICHLRKAEKAGLKVGTETFVYNVMKVPEPPKEFKEKLEQHRKKDREFQQESEENFDDVEEDFKPHGNTMLVRARNVGGTTLEVDGAVQLPNGNARRLFEATITSDEAAKKVTAVIINRFPHGRKKEEGFRLDLSATNVTISDGTLTEAANAVVELSSQINGHFGKLRIDYAHDRAAVTDKIRFFHDGAFTDFFGKTYGFNSTVKAVQNATCGCGNGTFTGSVPAIPASELVQNVPSASRTAVLTDIASKEGIASLTESLKVCPEPKGLSLATGDSCSVTHSFGECYQMSWKNLTTDLGLALKDRKYSVIAASQCTGPNSANASYELLTSGTVDVSYTREWDGTIPAGEEPNIVGLTKLTPADFKECAAFEERFRNRKGSGGEQCFHQEHRKAVENEAKDDGITLADTADHENFNGHQVEIKNEHTESFSRTRCWDSATCVGQPISAQLVSRDDCKAIGGKGWGPDSSNCVVP